MQRRLKLVLDTNIVLDWLVFGDPTLAALRKAMLEERVAALTHAPAQAELARVLAYPQFKLNVAQQAEVLAAYGRHCIPADGPGAALPTGFPHCRDPDDVHFLALAYREQAPLVSRDKSVLAIRARAARFGVHILDVRALKDLLALEIADV
jgi:putative PIN family toxin of toxin-antitoxin system